MRFLLSVTIERVLHETKLKIRVEQEKRKNISFNLTEAHAILRQLGKDFFTNKDEALIFSIPFET